MIGENVVYRFYGHDGSLLYIGRSHTMGVRLKAHRNNSPWWDEVAAVAVKGFGGEALRAGRAEMRAITREQPRYNHHGQARDGGISTTVKLPQALHRQFRIYALRKGLTMQKALAEIIRAAIAA